VKKIIIIVIVLGAGFWIWKSLAPRPVQPLYNHSYIIVYGRDACGLTQRFLSELNRAGIGCIYKSIDEPKARAEIIPRMKIANLNTSSFRLPVVDVNAHILTNPDVATVLKYYRKAPQSSKKPIKNILKTVEQIAQPSKTYTPGTLEVSGIITGDEPVAIIDGNVVKEGQRIGGYIVETISQDSVTFRTPDNETITKAVLK